MKNHQNTESRERDDLTNEESPAENVGDVVLADITAQVDPTDAKAISTEESTVSAKDSEKELSEPTVESIAARLNIPEFNPTPDPNEHLAAPIDEDLAQTDEEEPLEEVPVDAPEDLSSKTPLKKPQNIFQRLRQKHEEQKEAHLSDAERIRKKSGLSAEDVALAIEFGYEDELGRLVGYDGLKTLKQEYKETFGKPSSKHYRTSFGYSGEETITDDTAPAIIAKYMRDRKALITRTLITAIAAFLLLFLDYPQLWGGALDPFIAQYPIALPLVSLAILCLVSVYSFRQINAGLRSFLKASPTPYSVPATMLVLVLLYDAVTLFLQEDVLRVNTLTCSLLVVLALCDIHRLTGEIRAFHIANAEGEKTVLEPAAPRKKILQRDGKVVKVINDDIDVTFYRVQRAHRITGFFRRFNATRSAHLPFQTMIGIIIAFATVIAFIAATIRPSLSYALSTFITVMFVASPTTAMFSFFYPLQRANKILAEHDCILVGNEAVGELSDPLTLIFDDADLYTTERRTEITVKDSDELRQDLKLAGTLLRRLGGTLDCLSKTIGTDGEDPTVSFSSFSDNGVEATVSDRHILFGDSEYMKRNDVRIPKESTEQALRRTKDTAILHFAVDGTVKFTYEIEYVAKLSFVAIIEELADIDVTVALQSYDPAINDTFLEASLADKGIRVRAIKPGRYESKEPLNVADTGAVALGHPYHIVAPIHAAKAIKRSKRFGTRLQIFASALGILTAGCFAFLPEINILTPLSVTLYHGLFIVITWLYSHLTINRHTLHIRRFF